MYATTRISFWQCIHSYSVQPIIYVSQEKRNINQGCSILLHNKKDVADIFFIAVIIVTRLGVNRIDSRVSGILDLHYATLWQEIKGLFFL